MLGRLKKLGARIRPREWNSGEHVVIMGVVAPFGGAEQVLEEVKAKVFSGQEVQVLQDFDLLPKNWTIQSEKILV